MAGIQVANLAGMFEQGRTASQDDRKRSALAKLMQPALGGDKAALGGLHQAGAHTEAMAAQKYGQDQQGDAREQFGKASVMLSQLGDGPQAQQAYSQWRQHGISAGVLPPDVPEQFEPGSLRVANAAAQAYGGMSSKGNEPRIVAPGSALVGNDGKMIYERPFAPAKRQLVNVPDGQGGMMQMEYDGESFHQPNYGGQPQARGPSGGASQVLDSAYQDSGDFVSSVQGLVSPLGGRITSTTGGRHNPGSKHYSGNAIDVGMGRETPEQQSQILAALQGQPGLVIRDERQRPPGQREWSGPHLHVERGGRMGYTPPKVKAGGATGFKGSDFQLVTQPDGSVVRVNKVDGTATPIQGVSNYSATSQREDQKQIAKMREKLPTMTAMRDQLSEMRDGLKTGKYSTGAENLAIPDAIQSDANQYAATVLNQQILEMATEMKGALSDKDVAFLRTGTMSLNKGEAANMAIIDQKLKVLNDAIKRAEKRTGQGGADIKPGHVEGGYRFKGGNAGDPNSWEKI